MAPPSEPIRILLVDNDSIVREGLQLLIDRDPNCQVIGTAEDGATALEVVAREQPDIILLELELASDSGIRVLATLRATAPKARVMLLTRMHDPAQHLQAVQLGAMGIVRKDQTGETLMAAIKHVHQGEAWLEATLAGQLITDYHRRPKRRDVEVEKIATLTAREHTIIALVCQGRPNSKIGAQLKISTITVRHHLSAIFRKLGVTSRLELAIYAFRHRLATPPQ